jgi:hypothetical protein
LAVWVRQPHGLMIGNALLAILLPARRFLSNVDATALGVTIIGIRLLALAGGMLFEMAELALTGRRAKAGGKTVPLMTLFV